MTLSTAPEIRRDARKARRHARHRAALLDAAREVLAEEGLPGFTVARVAGRADVSKPSFYYYFRSREELVAALADQIAAEEATELTRAAYAAHDGAAALDADAAEERAGHEAKVERYARAPRRVLRRPVRAAATAKVLVRRHGGPTGKSGTGRSGTGGGSRKAPVAAGDLVPVLEPRNALQEEC